MCDKRCLRRLDEVDTVDQHFDEHLVVRERYVEQDWSGISTGNRLRGVYVGVLTDLHRQHSIQPPVEEVTQQLFKA